MKGVRMENKSPAEEAASGGADRGLSPRFHDVPEDGIRPAETPAAHGRTPA